MNETIVETTETIKNIIEWHEQTFPDATRYGQLLKFKEKAKEYHDTHNPDELVDMFIVACGMARFSNILAMQYFGMVYQFLCLTDIKVREFGMLVERKMEKNRKRVWNKVGSGIYHHKNGIED